MELHSTAFRDGEQISRDCTRDGRNVTPPLWWRDLPDGTRELAIIFDSVTPSTRAPFTQWLAYGLSPELEGLPEGIQHERDPEQPPEMRQGTNEMGNVGYDGPLGSTGRRMRYVFRLYALDELLGLSAGVDRQAFERAAEGHVLAEAELRCEYERPRS